MLLSHSLDTFYRIPIGQKMCSVVMTLHLPNIRSTRSAQHTKRPVSITGWRFALTRILLIFIVFICVSGITQGDVTRCCFNEKFTVILIKDISWQVP